MVIWTSNNIEKTLLRNIPLNAAKIPLKPKCVPVLLKKRVVSTYFLFVLDIMLHAFNADV
ncbi:hypothetical protein BAA08_00695 [Bizionia sp. APA-3]|nr:hypothetical protein BAA08_00695 [Bizionia sp. APA-3]